MMYILTCSLNSGDVHVDKYGFKHVFDDEGLLLHYLCQELTHHYLLQAGSYEEHQKKWTQFMRQHGKSICDRVSSISAMYIIAQSNSPEISLICIHKAQRSNVS